MRCLFERAQCIAQGQEYQREQKHLRKVLGQNGYPTHFIRDATKPKIRTTDQETPGATICIPYIRGLSEDIRRITSRYNIRTTFRTQGTLRQTLTRVKDELPDTLKANVVYRVPCSCGKVYIGETKRALGTRIKEHQSACRLQQTKKSAIAEHAWSTGHSIDWGGVEIMDIASKKTELLVKEAIHIHLTPKDRLINRDTGLQIPESWNWTLQRMTSSRGGARYLAQRLPADAVTPGTRERVQTDSVAPRYRERSQDNGRSSNTVSTRTRREANEEDSRLFALKTLDSTTLPI